MISIFSVSYLTCGVLFLFLGLIALKENPRLRINRVTGTLLFFAAFGTILRALGLLVDPQSLQQPFVSQAFVLSEFFFPQLVIFSLSFPKIIVSTKLKRIFFLIFLPYIFHFVLVLLFNRSDDILILNSMFDNSFFAGILQPLAIMLKLIVNIFAFLFDIHLAFYAFTDLVYFSVALAIMIQSYQHISDFRLRKQAFLIWCAILIGVGFYAIAFLLPKIGLLHFSSVIAHSLSIMGLVIGIYTFAWALIKYRFLDIRFFIGKSVILSAGSGILIGLYLLIYNFTKQFFHRIFGIEIPILEILLLIMAAVFFQPIIEALENVVKKYFLKEKPDYESILQKLSQDILAMLDITELREQIKKTLIEAFAIKNAELLLETSTGAFSTGETDNPGIGFERGTEFLQFLSKQANPVEAKELARHISEPDLQQSIQQLNTLLFIPLIHRESLIGILCLGAKSDDTTFTAHEITLINIFSGQIVIALEYTKLYQDKLEKQRIDEEITLAREIQRMLLPHQIPQGKHFQISAFNIPSKEVGGDYYDFIHIDDNLIGIAIGDISGKGIPGALLMSNLQATFRSVAQLSQSPAEVMRMVNIQISRTTTPEKYATFFYGNFDSKSYLFTYTNAGHNFPMIIPRVGVPGLLKESELIIGIDEKVKYSQHQIQLSPGDLLIFYTDGITEALNADQMEFGEERFLAIIMNQAWHSPQHLRDIIYETVTDFTVGTNQYDDMTLVIFQVM